MVGVFYLSPVLISNSLLIDKISLFGMVFDYNTR